MAIIFLKRRFESSSQTLFHRSERKSQIRLIIDIDSLYSMPAYEVYEWQVESLRWDAIARLQANPPRQLQGTRPLSNWAPMWVITGRPGRPIRENHAAAA